jgi:23S rRNA pseudouridine955/2504/2580 synthase
MTREKRTDTAAYIRNIPILFENERCLVLDKPAGLAVQGGEGVGASLDAILAAEVSPRPFLVHRLDKDTSGVILVAKNREAAAMLGRFFKEKSGGAVLRGAARRADYAGGHIRKIYTALCAGIGSGTDLSAKDLSDTGVIRLDLDTKGGVKKAETRYKTLEKRRVAGGEGSGETVFLVELELGTGRMHQIRRHLALCGCPVIGDDKYGDFKLNKRLRKSLGVKRLMLHASRLVIPAETGFPLDVSSPAPDCFGFFWLKGEPLC